MTSRAPGGPFRVRVAPEDQHAPLSHGALALVLATVSLRLFGLPPIDLHGPLHPLGVMDPLCGGTRAALAVGRGDLGLAWEYNPLVPVLALVVGASLARWCWGRATGRWITVNVDDRRALIILLGVLVVALWLNQQANAELLMSGPEPRLRLWGSYAG